MTDTIEGTIVDDTPGFDKAEWQRRDRAKFKAANGFTRQADYGAGGNRLAVLERDGYACVRCGMTDAEHKARWGRPITVDHISKDRSDNSMSNLQTLCLRCHGAKDILPELVVPRIPEKRGEILAMRARGATYQKIADATEFSIGGVWKWVQRWERAA